MVSRIFTCLFLTACSGETFARELITLPDGSAPEVDAIAPDDDAASAIDAPSSQDAPLVDAPIFSDVDSGPMCKADGGSCTAGACCAGLHCISGACASCKPKGFLAKSSGECCDPQSFNGESCGALQDKCGIPMYSGCVQNSSTCCPGSTCKFQGQYWQCSCGIVDTPCNQDGQCCSNKCSASGWCS